MQTGTKACMVNDAWQEADDNENDNLWKNVTYYLGLVARKPVFGVSDKVIFKQISSTTETS